MYCSKCGKQLPEESGFCAYCGEKLRAVDASMEVRTSPMTDVQFKPATIPNKKPATIPNKKLLLIFIVIVGIIIFMPVITQCASRGGEKPGIGTQNISTEQMKSDLRGKDVPFYYKELRFGDDVAYSQFEIKKTLSKDDLIHYYIDVTVSGLDTPNTTWFVESYSGTIILTYRKYREGWELVDTDTVTK